MDHIVIRDLELKARIGVHAWEGQIPQSLRLQLKLGYDLSTVAKSDDISQALNYQGVIEFIEAELACASPQLIETLAEGLAQRLLQHFAIAGLELELCKPHIMPGKTEVGVFLRRGAPL